MGMRDTLSVVNQMVADEVIDSYAIGGAVAAFNYVQVASTDDLDVLVSFDDFARQSGLITLEPIAKYLAEKGYADFRSEGYMIEGWPVQFLPVANPLDAEGLAEAQMVEIEPTEGAGSISVRILRAEHVVATALALGRSKDRLRIVQFVEEGAVDYDLLCPVLERHDLTKAWENLCDLAGIPDPCAKSGLSK